MCENFEIFICLCQSLTVLSCPCALDRTFKYRILYSAHYGKLHCHLAHNIYETAHIKAISNKQPEINEHNHLLLTT